MAGVGDAVVHDSAVAVDVGHADDRNPPRGLRRHCPLLRARRERPRGRAAECGYQLPPSDGDCHVMSALDAKRRLPIVLGGLRPRFQGNTHAIARERVAPHEPNATRVGTVGSPGRVSSGSGELVVLERS